MRSPETSTRLEQALAQARRSGWGLVELDLPGGSPGVFLSLCETLGQSVPSRVGKRVDVLSPREPANAAARTLSRANGTGSFPAHFDGAHLSIPPRFVILYCAMDTQSRPTLLFQWSDVVRDLVNKSALYREVFVFGSGRRSFYDTIASAERPFVRYDSGCMSAMTRGAALLLEEIRICLCSEAAVTIDWSPGMTLVIDNWSMLHARAPGSGIGSRQLLRVLLEGV
jgi:alpha-ketoglutarate-dependent taurine dioxygenase